MVYAPAVEELGHPHHNMIGEIAGQVFKNVTYYMTYTRNGKSVSGNMVRPEFYEWPLKKLQALSCYESQITRPDQWDHWLREQYEYYAS
jgi:hypothetical protein